MGTLVLQGCQMVYFEKIQIWVNFGGSLNVKMLYFMDIRTILHPFGIFYGHLVYFV
jgi:hypothetical protein